MNWKKSTVVLGLGTCAVALAGAAVACGSESGAGIDLVTQGDASSEASSSSSSGGGSSSSGGSSGGARPADDAGVTADGGVDPPGAGPGGDTQTIACGTATCPIPAETCCVSELASGGNNGYSCVASPTCPAPAGGGATAALKCSAGANCAAGTVCCVRDDNGNASSECKPSCANDEAQLCDLNAGDAGGCPPADPCSNDNIDDWGDLPNGYATCGGRGN